MMRFVVLACLMAAASSKLIKSREELEEMFPQGTINWDPTVKTSYCSECTEITVESFGGALEHQPNRLGRFTVAGSLWENMVPLYKADNNQYVTPDPMSNPIIYYVKWVISETVGGFNAGVQNNAYTDGITCPYEIPDQWEYEWQRQWYIDPTLKITCTQRR